MVGEEQHLGLAGEFPQHSESSARAPVVEIDEEIVGDERQGVAAAQVVFNGGDPQREIELVGGALLMPDTGTASLLDRSPARYA